MLTLVKKILPPLLPGFELATFRSRDRRSNQQAIPAPADPLIGFVNLATYGILQSFPNQSSSFYGIPFGVIPLADRRWEVRSQQFLASSE